MATTLEKVYIKATQLDVRLVGVLILLYVVFVSIYRIYLSPLAHFPGPKIAALTTWYAGYHDLFRGGQYIKVVEQMHYDYGPIVRIRPDLLHVNDPKFMDILYSQSPKQRRERYSSVLQSFQAPGSILGTRDHELHRKRRAVLNPFFSQQNVRRLSGVISQTMFNLLRRMDGWAAAGRPVEMNLPFRAATKDVIQSYAFGGGVACLDIDDCNSAFFDIMLPSSVTHLGPHMYYVSLLLINMPSWLMRLFIPRMGAFIEFLDFVTTQIEGIKSAKERPESRTIFHEIIQGDIPESEKNTQRLAEEAGVFIMAGTDTTSSTLAAITFELLSDRDLLNCVRAELKTAIPDPTVAPDVLKLDKLPLFNAVIQECLRMYPGATLRQDRVAPDEELIYTYPDGRTLPIPKGTAIGMCAPFINRHPSIYDRPNEFLPERYIKDPKLSRWLFSFSKGARQCIGINLAHEELKIFTAGIFRKYDLYSPASEKGDGQKAGGGVEELSEQGPTLELHQTTREDVAMWADFVTPGPVPGSKGLRLVIRR